MCDANARNLGVGSDVQPHTAATAPDHAAAATAGSGGGGEDGMSSWSPQARKAMLFNAIDVGDTAKAVAIVRSKADPNSREHGRTALTAAATKRFAGLIDALLVAKADVDAPADDGWTPLLKATAVSPASFVRRAGAASSSAVVVARLLAARADVTAAAPGSGVTALMAASAHHNNTDVLGLLLAAKARVNEAAGADGKTALMFAAGINSWQSVEVLLAAKADTAPRSTVRGGDRSALLHAATASAGESLQRLLEAKADVGARGSAPGAPMDRDAGILSACQNGNVRVVQLLLACGGGACTATDALWRATLSSKASLVQNLLLMKANVNEPPQSSNDRAYSSLQTQAGLGAVTTVLGMATAMGSASIVSLLLDAGAAVNEAACERGLSALSIAVRNNTPTVVRILVGRGADVNPRLPRGVAPPLTVAAALGGAAVVRMLLRAGADPNACSAAAPSTASDDGGTIRATSSASEADSAATYPSALAAVIGLSRRAGTALPIVDALLEAKADATVTDPARAGAPLTVLASWRNNVHALHALIRARADIDAPTVDGRTAMTECLGRDRVLKTVAALTADINCPCPAHDGATPLMLAAGSAGAGWGIPSLLQHRADVNAQTSSGETALHRAAAWAPVNVQHLLPARADVNAARATDGWTVLHSAVVGGEADTVRALVSAKASVDAATTDTGWTPLMLAARLQNVCVLLRLLEDRPVNVAAVAADGVTSALSLAMAEEARLPPIRNGDDDGHVTTVVAAMSAACRNQSPRPDLVGPCMVTALKEELQEQRQREAEGCCTIA